MELKFDFASDDRSAGFRLKYFEFYNWGTFDKRVIRVELNGDNALLTGEIGSGKSTVVDGLTTLLVPHHKITFNKAAGAESRERSLKSYITGEYKSQKDENLIRSKAVALRGEESFTVLLARFENEGYDESFTVAQFFYFSNKKVHKIYATCRVDMSIKDDFLDVNFKDIRGLKKYLKKRNHTLVYDSFREYAKDFKRAMGIKNDQALNLFYQTVSLKAIGNLTNFVREQMLEAGDIDAKIDELCQNFADLNHAYTLVLRAKEQIGLLTPIDKTAKVYKEQLCKQDESVLMREGLSLYFLSFKEGLLVEKLAQLEIDLQKALSKKEIVDEKIEELTNKKIEIKVEIQKNAGDRLKHLQSEIESSKKELNSKKDRNKSYNSIASELGLATVSNEHRFLNNQKEAKDRFETIAHSSTKLQNEIVRAEVSLEEYRDSLRLVQEEVLYLQNNRSNIPKHISSIRDKIANHLGVDEEDLPFIGELIEVVDKQWQGAIERVMHSFSLSLLIEDEYYDEVSEYVNSTDLRGKLVYLKVIRAKRREEYYERAKNSLIHKITIKPNSPFFEPIRGMLEDRFDIPCVESMRDFRKFKKALSINGQFKTNYARHEKDDRFRLDDKSRWSLGWDSAVKLEAMQKKRVRLDEKVSYLEKEIKALHVKMGEIRESEYNLRDMLKFDSFKEIDWYRYAKKIEGLNEEFEELNRSSNILKSLQNQLDKIDEKLKKSTPERESLDRHIGKLESDIKLYMSELEEIKEFSSLDEELRLKIDTLFSQKGLNLQNILAKERELRATIQSSLDAISKRLKNLSEKLLKLMHDYKSRYSSQSKDFDASIGSIDDFKAKLTELKKDDLPKFEKRFKLLFKEKTIQKMVMIQEELEHQANQIKEKIKEINRSLSSIEYNSGTFIELVAELSIDQDTREFRQKLKSATSFVFDEKNEYDESKFLQIKEIIDRFNGREGFSEIDKRWRAKVSDVRQWHSFSAIERYLSTGEEREYYAHSGGKSGGQKEKLAYTVLASSLAFQFGLEYNEIKSRSFRFVMIDEAFGRGSDESTKYALRLFEKLNLQLLAITPKQKINVIENFVKSIHFVHNQDGMNSSIVSMSIEKYRENRG